MAHALRTIWLEDIDEQQPQAVQPRARRRPQPAPPARWQHPAVLSGVIVALVAVAMLFVHCNDVIAQREIRCRELRQELAQLNRECVQLNLELERLAAEPNLTHVARAQGLELPAADRIHYSRVAADLPRSAVAAAPAHKGGTLLASWQGFWQRLGETDPQPAFAQD